MLKDILKKRDFLPISNHSDGRAATKESWQERRVEMIRLLETYSYGKTPEKPSRVWGEHVWSEYAYRCCAGKASHDNVKISFETEKGIFSFPVDFYIPKSPEKPPMFLYLSFGHFPDRYIPLEEIIDNGYAVAVLCYKDVVNDNDNGDYTDGIAKYFGTTIDRAPDEWGKIGMWAYAASRVLDYVIAERDDVDSTRVAVIGHSRLGKTALWAGAQDERFAAVISNNSGYGGAASSKGGTGERVTDFLRVGSWDWFCENFKQFTGELEDKKPYDQSFLLSLIAPRYLLVGSAETDRGADPMSEFLTTLHASSAWELLGEIGLICPDRMPVPGDSFGEGRVHYHLRPYGHFLSREDWGQYIRFLDSKWGK